MAGGCAELDRDLVERLGVIFWEADPVTLQFMSVSPNAEAVLGYPHLAWTSNRNFWGDLIHPDDRERVLVARIMAIARCEDHRLAYRIIVLDGRTRWMREAARLKCENGQAKQMCGVMIDVTAATAQFTGAL